ncbi:MAG: hypothetical protein VZQ83_04445 [Eubacterium sp.]|nr:hypothetical protein [Eubacterium sp.]
MKNNFLLLKAMLLSTSSRNTRKYTTDKKKKRKCIGSAIGTSILHLILIGYTVLTCVGFGVIGIIDAAPGMCALIISVLAFFFTIFKTNGYLFNFKEYDMLMSLPFSPRAVAGCKFLYMYTKSLPWYLSISIGTAIVYGIYAKPSILVYPIWLILTFFVPIIPTLVAAFFGFIITRISAGFKKRHIIQTVLMTVLILGLFSMRFFIEDLAKNDKLEDALKVTSDVVGDVVKAFPPAAWFAGAIKDLNILDILLLVGITSALFIVVFLIVGHSYRNINSALKSHAAARNFRLGAQKSHSIVRTIAFKEYRRLVSSSNYMVNGAMGEIIAVVFGVATICVGFDRIVNMVTRNAPFDHQMIYPAIPFIIHFFIGMVATTAISPSLEGKSYWIVQSLPIEKKQLYQGKMLFNMYLSVPFTCFSTLLVCISAKVAIVDIILYLILGVLLCAFATTWGCLCGVKHMKLDWENELDVIKRGAAVSIYLLPNMFGVMGMAALAVFLGTKLDHYLLTGIFIAVTALLAWLCYWRVMVFSKKSF